MATITEALRLGLQHQQAGRLELAAEIYRRILSVEPEQPDALHLLGLVAQQSGRYAESIDYIQRALALHPANPAFHNNLGEAYRAAGRIAEAVTCYRRALQVDERQVESHHNLGLACQQLGQFDEAAACYRRVLELKPDFAEAFESLGFVYQSQGKLPDAEACYRRALQLKPAAPETCNNLGIACHDQGRLDDAVAWYRRAAELQPDFAEAYSNLGIALTESGRLDEAVECCRRAVRLKPDYAEAYNNLGVALKTLLNLDDALACYRRAVALKPDFAQAHNNLAIALKDAGQLDDAIAGYQRALQLKPDYAEAHNNLGIALKEQGRLDEAAACYRRALELKPDFAGAHSNLVYTLNFSSECDARQLYAAARAWNRQHAEPLRPSVKPHVNDRSAERRLRIGYVSPDFRLHPIGRFLLPLIEAHDHAQFEIFCYASLPVADAITARFRAAADAWRDVFGLADEKLADVIRQDRIDILVDLTMHMADNRLLAFARKPAPVQATYLAYCGTTGLEAIDYRLTDPHLDPPGGDDSLYAEQSVRLPDTYWCYPSPAEAPPCEAVPAARGGHVTFGCLNNFCKAMPPTLAAWGRVLQAVPHARLLLHAQPGSHRDRVRDLFARQGVSPDRVSFAEKVSMAEYFQLYGRIDVALDPFPYGGGTTTCDALWMGVPVVSLVGRTAVGRGGLSILSNVGLPELAAVDVEQYVRLAVELANDVPRLGQLRRTLRERMRQSPLMDARRFAQNVEAAYRQMWRRWCAG